MLPSPNIGIGALSLPQLPPNPSGPVPSVPGQFGRLYDSLMTAEDRAKAGLPGLPTQMEVAPILMPNTDLSQPFKASPEFPGAVDPTKGIGPDGLKVPGANRAETAENGFAGLLKPFQEHLSEVNKLQHDSSKLANEAALGGDVDLHDVMIASEKASVAMQLTMAIRNKLVEGYQEVMRMQV
jgi:flagellar hook-basal body complex protein FliE